MNSTHDILAEYEDKRLQICGIFDRFSLVTKNYRDVRTALIQDVYVHVEGKDIDVGHVWIQHAEPFISLGLKCGDRIRCNCRLKSYRKRLQLPNRDGLMVEERISFCFPTELEVISRSGRLDNSHAPEPLPVDQSPQLLVSTEEVGNTAKLILEVRRIARLAGGFDALQQLVDALRAEA